MTGPHSSSRGLAQAAFVLAVVLLSALAVLSVVTAQIRESRTVGVIQITADTFTDLGGGMTRAQGHVRLGNDLYLTGAGDAVVFDSGTVTGTGSLALGAGTSQVSLFAGVFHASGATGLAIPGAGATGTLGQVAGFAVTAAPLITQVNIPAAAVTGAASLHLTPPGVDAVARADFSVSSGLIWGGNLGDFALATAGVTLTVPAGALLTDSNIAAPVVTLTLPPMLGGGSAPVSGLDIQPGSLHLGGGEVDFPLPDLLFGDGSQIKLTNNRASLAFSAATSDYQLSITDTLSLNLPENSLSTPMVVRLARVGGQPRLSGLLDQLSLTAAGTTLKMNQLAVDNLGLHAAQASLTMPEALGGSHAIIYDVRISKDGLSVAGGAARFQTPDIRIGDGAEVSLQRGEAQLAVEEGAYRLDVTADLVLTLPENNQTIPIDFHLRGGQITGTVGAINLSVAGCTLAISQASISNSGLYVPTATLTAPPKLGGLSAEIKNVRIGDHGLETGEATVVLPDLCIGGCHWTSKVSIRLSHNVATLAVLSDGSGYTLDVSGELSGFVYWGVYSIDPPAPFQFTLSYHPETGFKLYGHLDSVQLGLTSEVWLKLFNVIVHEDGLTPDYVEIKLPASLGGGKVRIYVKVTVHGIEVLGGKGAFDLPPISLADGKLEIIDGHASFETPPDTYSCEIAAKASLVLHLPENSQTIPVAFKLDSHGNITGTVEHVSLNVASTVLSLNQVVLNKEGLATNHAELQLPPNLGSASIGLDDVRITRAGLTFGPTSTDVPLPDFNIGEHISFRQNHAHLSASNTGDGEVYGLAVDSLLHVTLPDNDWQQGVGFMLRHTAGGPDLSGTGNDLVLYMGGLLLSMESFRITLDGLYMDTAELDLPIQGPGGRWTEASVIIHDVSITRDKGLDIGDIPLPDFEFGGQAGSEIASAGRLVSLAMLERVYDARAAPGPAANAPLALRNNRARVHAEGGHLVLQVSSTLEVSLADNPLSAQFSFQIIKDGTSYRLSGALDQLVLNIAGCTLTMNNPTLDGTGLHISSVTLTLPSSLGGSAPAGEWHITGSGLAGPASIPLPTVTFGGDGSQISITDLYADLAKDAGGHYMFVGSGTLRLRLPSANTLDTTLSFTLRRGGLFDADLTDLSLKVAGAALSAQNIDINNTGLHAANATFTLPGSLGGESVTIRNIEITEDGLSFGRGAFPLAAIRIGHTLAITDIMAELSVEGSNYTLIAGGAVNLNLYDFSESYAISFSIDSDGNLAGVIDQMQLTVAGCTLAMNQLALNNEGLSVSVATLQLPADLGGSTSTVNDVRLTGEGLSIGGGSFLLPDILIGDGSKVRIHNALASIAAGTTGYTLGIAGTLQIRLPQNSLDTTLAAQVDTSGHVSGTVSQLTLQTASIVLKLRNVSFSNTGLAVAQGTLDLTNLGGRADFQVNNVSIDKDGLHLGGPGLTFAINEQIRLGGGSTGFGVQVSKGTLGIGADRTYQLTLVGTIQLEVPGNSGAQATGTIVVDSHGNFSGSMEGFALTVAGLSLQVTDVAIVGDTLELASARLAAPSEWGGEKVEVDNVTISKLHGIRIGGGSFALPDIHAGGFIVSAQGSLQPDGDGYLIAAAGKFGVPGLNSSGSCAVGVEAKLQTHGSATVLTLSPATRVPDQAAAIYLREAHLELNCPIPIGATGFSLSRIEGTVTLDQGTTRVLVGASIASDLSVGVPALRGDVDLSMSTDPTEFGLAGSLYVFIFHASQLSATIKEADGFRGTLWIEAIVARGRFTIHAWSASGKFHLTGSSVVEIGVPKGKILSWSLPYPCCTCEWYDCYKTSCWDICYNGLYIPPEDLVLGNVGAQFGEFSAPGGASVYGFKGTVSMMGYSAGFFVDSNGTLTFGNTDQYQLVDSQQVAEARLLWREAARRGVPPAISPAGLEFVDDNVTRMSVPVSTTTDLIFALSGSGNPPAVSLMTPGGTMITPDDLPPNVQYRQTFTRTVAVPWQAAGVTQAPPANCRADQPAPRLTGQVAGVSASAGEVRVFNAAPDVLAADGTQAVDVLVNDVKRFSRVPYADAHYVALEPGAYTLQVRPADLAGPVLVTTTLHVVTGTDYSVVVLGQQPNVTAVTFTDASAPVAPGTAQVRLMHAAPGTAALDLAVAGGSLLAGNVAFGNVSGYASLPAGTRDLELRPAGTLAAVVRLPGARLSDGSSYTVLADGLAGGNSPLDAVLLPDVYTYPVTQTMYVVQGAQPGIWQVQLTGGTGPGDQYALSVLGSNPPPMVTAVSAVNAGPEAATVTWQLTSGEADTALDIYVTPGPITYTQAITQPNGITTTVVLPLYTGIAAAKDLAAPRDPTWINGTLHTYTLDLSHLESGTYWVWLKVEDMRNAPVQVYAPAPIEVRHDAPAGWDAHLTATPGYRQLDVQWRAHPHADVDGYVLYVGTTPRAPTRAIPVGDATSIHLPTLDPGRTYYLSVAALDGATGREVRSPELAATAGVADFAMMASPGTLDIVGGHTDSVVMTLTTALTSYPASVYLYAGCLPLAVPLPYDVYLPLVMKGHGGTSVARSKAASSASCEIQDGIDVLFASQVVTPTTAGVPVTALVSATDSLPGGKYRVPLAAYGGGVTRTLDLLLNVHEPYFTLSVDPAAAVLPQNGAVTVAVAATGVHGEDDPIHLDLLDVPPGLAWGFSDDVLVPGSSVTLTLADTYRLGNGVYPLRIRGEDGENTEVLPLTLILSEPGFTLVGTAPRSRVLAGRMTAIALDTGVENGWTGPVTLSVDPQSVPARTLVGFLAQPDGATAGTSDRLEAPPIQVVVMPPSRVFLALVTTANTPAGLYRIRVQALGAGPGGTLQQTITIFVEVYDELPGSQVYLPLTP